MKILKLTRTLKEGLGNIKSGGWLSFATVIIITISLYIIGFTLLVGYISNFTLDKIREKINVTIYFSPEVKREKIFEIQEKLSQYTNEIKSIRFVSKEDALQELKALSAGNETVNQALEEIGENPLSDSLEIKAHNPEQYETIVGAINNSVFRGEIIRVNYDQNKSIIERINNIAKLMEKLGFFIGIVFIFLSVLMTFNTIRITMHSRKQEFEIKRLVGASNVYVEMPFIFEGMIYGLLASILSLAALFGTIYYVAYYSQRIIEAGSLMSIYWHNFFVISGALFFSGIFLGVLGSFLAIRKYLKI